MVWSAFSAANCSKTSKKCQQTREVCWKIIRDVSCSICFTTEKNQKDKRDFKREKKIQLHNENTLWRDSYYETRYQSRQTIRVLRTAKNFRRRYRNSKDPNNVRSTVEQEKEQERKKIFKEF